MDEVERRRHINLEDTSCSFIYQFIIPEVHLCLHMQYHQTIPVNVVVEQKGFLPEFADLEEKDCFKCIPSSVYSTRALGHWLEGFFYDVFFKTLLSFEV